MSFLTPGIFWTGHRTQLGHRALDDRHLARIHIAILYVISR
jgi:hypothetical protein